MKVLNNRIEFTEDEKKDALQKLEDSTTILPNGDSFKYKLNLSYEDIKKYRFIAYGFKEVKLNNVCSALHRKVKKCIYENGFFMLNHNDYDEYYEIKYEDGTIKYFQYIDVDGYCSREGAANVSEIWNNWELDFLSFKINKIYNSRIERLQDKSLDCSCL
jgi:hypothetical protein